METSSYCCLVCLFPVFLIIIKRFKKQVKLRTFCSLFEWYFRCQQLLHQKDGPSWREKFKVPSLNPWDVPEIIGLDGHSTAQVVYNNPVNNQSQPSSQTNNQSQPSSQTSQSTSSLTSQSKTSTTPSAKVTEEKKITLSPQQKFDELKSKGNECVKKVITIKFENKFNNNLFIWKTSKSMYETWP